MTACTSAPVFTDGADASGGDAGTGASGGDADGASNQGGAGAMASGGDASTGGLPGGGGEFTTGGSGPGGQGAGGNTVDACGDGTIDINVGEQCDDANLVSDDGCSACIVDCPAGGYKDPATSHCYFIVGPTDDWYDGGLACSSTTPGTTRVAFGTASELMLVDDALGPDKVWTGGHDLNIEGVFEWANGEPWMFGDGGNPWGPNQPDDSAAPGPADCVALQDSGLFDRDCELKYEVLCERVPIGQ